MPHRLRLLILLCLSLYAVSCKPRDTAQTKPLQRIALLSAQTKQSYDAAQAQYLARLVFAREDCELQTWVADNDASLQAAQLNEAIAQRPMALLISPVSSAALAPVLKEAMQAGTLVLGLGEESLGLPAHSHLIVGQQEMGRLAGQAAVEALGKKTGNASQPRGRVVVLTGPAQDWRSNERLKGLHDALRSHPGVQIVHEAPTEWTARSAEPPMKDVLRLQPDFDILIGFNDLLASAGASLLKERRDEVLVIGMDGFKGSMGGLTMILEGRIDASIYQPPLVDLAFSIIVNRLKDDRFLPKTNYTLKPLLITPTKAEQYRVEGLPKAPQP
jgi:ribose transport system substrate-binding protein